MKIISRVKINERGKKLINNCCLFRGSSHNLYLAYHRTRRESFNDFYCIHGRNKTILSSSKMRQKTSCEAEEIKIVRERKKKQEKKSLNKNLHSYIFASKFGTVGHNNIQRHLQNEA